MEHKVFLELRFASPEAPVLLKSVFYAEESKKAVICLRGTTTHCNASFKWSPTAHALCIALARIAQLRDEQHKRIEVHPVLSGADGTPAAAIGRMYNRSRECPLLDIFGTDNQGKPLLYRAIRCINYRRRIPGPVEVFANTRFLLPEQIYIFLEGERIDTDAARLSNLVENLEHTWKPGNNGGAVKDKKAALRLAA